MWKSAQGEKFNLYFSRVFANINKTFILGGGPGTGLSYYEVCTVSSYFLISLDPKP